MNRFTVTGMPLTGLKTVERQRLGDSRGFLSRLFCAEELCSAGWSRPIAQINHTSTAHAGTIRGMHYQRPPHAEMKLVTCVRGEVWDVAVDLRAGSPTLLKWHAAHLSAENGRALLIPEGFAHGFQALSDDVELLYCHSAAHAPDADAGVHPLDPRLAIAWPLPIREMSTKDSQRSLLTEDFAGVPL